MAYIRLANTPQFTVTKYVKKYFSRFDTATKKFEKSDTYQPGFSLKFLFETDQGMLELSKDQVGQMLLAVMYDGKSDVNNRTFTVKTNGKSGMEVRYFINALNFTPPPAQTTTEEEYDFPTF